MDYFIIVVTTAAGLYFHWWLYVRIRQWMARDLALSLAGDDTGKRGYMLDSLQQAHSARLKGKALLTHFDHGWTLYSHNQLYGVWRIADADKATLATMAEPQREATWVELENRIKTMKG